MDLSQSSLPRREGGIVAATTVCALTSLDWPERKVVSTVRNSFEETVRQNQESKTWVEAGWLHGGCTVAQ